MRHGRVISVTARLCACLAVVVLAAPAVAAAQAELAVFQGTIVDEAGAPLEGASIRLRDPDRGTDTVVKSDKSGRFYRRGLRATEYQMVVEKDGYQSIDDKIRLTTGTDRRLEFKLAKASPVGEPGHIYLVSIDGTPYALEQVRQGLLDATISQPLNLYVKYGLQYLQDAVAGETFEVGETDHDSRVEDFNGNLMDLLPAPIVTAENVDDDSLWGNQVK